MAEIVEADKDLKKEEKKKPKSKNNIPILTTVQQAEMVELDLDSPRMIQAMDILQITPEDLEKKTNFRLHPNDDKDVLELRKKHFFSRYMDTINSLLLERRKVKMGKARMTHATSSQKEFPGTATMFKSFYKSQKKIQTTSPKDITKKRVELALQDTEDKEYKIKVKETRRRSLEEERLNQVELLKHKNMQKEIEAKKRQEEIEKDKERKIEEYEQRLKEKEKKIREFEKRLAERRVSHTTSPGLRHVQSQDNWNEDALLTKIEERNIKAQEKKFKSIRRRTSNVQKKNVELQNRLLEYSCAK